MYYRVPQHRNQCIECSFGHIWEFGNIWELLGHLMYLWQELTGRETVLKLLGQFFSLTTSHQNNNVRYQAQWHNDYICGVPNCISPRLEIFHEQLFPGLTSVDDVMIGQLSWSSQRDSNKENWKPHRERVLLAVPANLTLVTKSNRCVSYSSYRHW